ncbi:phage tail sheath family protein [Sporosarcina sp. Marseille-Q4943]|uniref:phage tail sheath family protein n=1 Tax=Sporosarcina sp. Marseille-Q4943 TaxID=2942204 RepID=UPI00208DAEB5|nr:phage tail sheath family protein [Sporosarcina sp. Marseille-Q4943]
MNGGTWTPGVEKERAGIYFRFISAANRRIRAGIRGRVALPLVLSWGESKKFFEITEPSDTQSKFGLDIDDPSLLLLREAKKRSLTVLGYRLNEGEKATASLGTDVTATAAHSGEKGNDILIRIGTNVLDETKKDVIVYFGLNQVDRQTVADAKDFVPNKYMSIDGTGPLEDTAGIKLKGGTDGTTTNLDYADFLAAAETEFWDTIGLPVEAEDELKVTFASFVRRLRDQQGVKVQGVLANSPADFEGIINVTNGAVLPEKTLTPAETVAWVAGASAGATIYQSLTFVEYEGAIDVNPRYDHDETVARLRKGEFMFTYDPREKVVTVEKDINSFVSFSSLKDKKFSKNKIMRIFDGINNDLTREVKAEIKSRKDRGQDIPTDDDGIQILTTMITIYMNILQEGGAIKNFVATEDINITINEDGDGFFINIGVQPVDSGEKFYFGIEAR